MENEARLRAADVGTAAVWLESEIPFFRAGARHVARLRAALPPGARVVRCGTEAGFRRALRRAEVALAWRFDGAWFAEAPRLRLLATPAAGREGFPAEAPAGVAVLHGAFHGALMAETVVGLMLAFERGILTAYAAQLAGELWPREAMCGARVLRGSHAVIVGFGRIGECVGRLLHGFGVRVTGVRRRVPAARPEWFGGDDAVVGMGELDAVLPSADHVVLVLPSDTGTDRMFDGRRLARLPRHAVLYNVGRGNSVDEAALAAALRGGRLRGACLDVFAREPLAAGSPLAGNLPGLVRLPHASAFDASYLDLFMEEVAGWLA